MAMRANRAVCFAPNLREKQLLNGRLRIHREKLQSMETTLKNTRKGDKGGMVSDVALYLCQHHLFGVREC